MSDHIQPVPAPAPAAQKKGGKLRPWLLFGGILLTVLLLLVIYLLVATTALDGVKRSLRYLGWTETSFSYDTNGLASATLISNSPALCDQSGVTLYTDDGVELGVLKRNLYTPVLQAAGDRLLLHDIGGTEVALLDAEANVLAEPEISGQIIDAALSETDRFAVLSTSDTANSILEVYYSDGTLLFRRTAKSHYLNTCALSPDGSYVAAVLMEQQNVSFTSTVQLFRTDAEEPIAEVPTDCGLVFDLAFVDDETLCAVGLYGLTFLGLDGSVISEYSFMDAGLTGYSIADGKVALTLDTYDLSARYRLVLLDARGEETAAHTLPEGTEAVSLCGRYVAVLGNASAQIYTTKLEPVTTAETGGAYSVIQVRRDGTAFLLGDQQALLLIPE
ncbi:MAG: hypothetical protein IJ357_05660 [Oscillospiraceae bacterium]|nr:hypothetical protein [Oscillospiraceae bacterium]